MTKYISLIIFLFSTLNINSQDNTSFKDLEDKYVTSISEILGKIVPIDRVKLSININSNSDNFDSSNRESYYVNVNAQIDGHWEKVYDSETGLLVQEGKTIKRKFIPLNDKYIKDIESIIKKSINYKENDYISVTATKFDRTVQFIEEDRIYLLDIKKRKTILTVSMFLFPILLLFIILICIRNNKKKNI